MSIDSDELFELDDEKLKAFYDSGKVFGKCFFPLYFTNHIIGHSTGLGSPPIKPIFINKASATVREIADSMFLLVPQDERTQRLGKSASFEEKLGIVHHISSFRNNGGSYRRARFYNLLSMRVAKKMSLIKGGTFETDSEFFEKISALSPEELEALDAIFEFHRINAAFPAMKENQLLVETKPARKDLQNMIDESFELMLDDQDLRLQRNAEKTFKIHSNRQMYFDVTRAVSAARQTFHIYSSSINQLNVKVYFDQGLTRSELVVPAIRAAKGEWSIALPPLGEKDIRCVLEVIPVSPNPIIDFRYSFANS